MTGNDILANAQTIIGGHRVGQYGAPEDSFEKIAKLWSAFLDRDISSAEVANMMILMKVARNANGVYKDDNWIDICGYAALGGEIQSRSQDDECEKEEEFDEIFEESLKYSIEKSFERWMEREMKLSSLDADHFGAMMVDIVSGTRKNKK